MKKRDKQSGFTIVELLISIMVIAILVAGINSIYTAHLIQSRQVRSLAMTTSFINNKVESLRSIGFLGLNNGQINITEELPSELMPPKSGLMTVTSPSSGLKKIVLDISYYDRGVNRTYSYATFIGELGVGQY